MPSQEPSIQTRPLNNTREIKAAQPQPEFTWGPVSSAIRPVSMMAKMSKIAMAPM